MTEIVHHRRALWKRKWVWIAASLLAVVAVLGGYRIWVEWTVAAELARIRAEGLPATLADVHAAYAEPEGPNAAAVYQQAFDLFVDDETLSEPAPIVGFARSPKRGEAWPQQLLAAGEAVINANAPALAKLREAADIEGCRFPGDFSQGGKVILLDHWALLRYTARLLRLQAKIQGQKGRSDEAAERVRDMFRHARRLDQQHILIPRLTQIAMLSMGVAAAEELLHDAPLGDDEVRRIRDALAPFLTGNRTAQVMSGERGYAMAMLASGKAFSLPTPGGRPLAMPDFTGRTGLIVLERLRPLVDQAKDLWAPAPLRQPVQGWTRTHTVLTQMEPAFEGALETERRSNLMLRVTDAGLAAWQFRLVRDRWPRDAAELAPDFMAQTPIDPVDGRPLRLTPRDGGLIVYSLGLAGQDHGGLKDNNDLDQLQARTDVTFALPAP